MSYDKVWIQDKQDPQIWHSASSAERGDPDGGPVDMAQKLYEKGNFVVLVAGGNFMSEEIFLFWDSAAAADFYDKGFVRWESFIGDEPVGLGFQEVALYRSGRRIALKTTSPSRRADSSMENPA